MPPPVTPEVALRAFVQPNNPLSGPYQPQKSDQIAILRYLLDALDALSVATGVDLTPITNLRNDLIAEIAARKAVLDEETIPVIRNGIVAAAAIRFLDGRYAPFLDAYGRVLQSLADGTLERVMTRQEVANLIVGSGGGGYAPAYTAQSWAEGQATALDLETSTALCMILAIKGQSNAQAFNTSGDAVVAGTAIYPASVLMPSGGVRLNGPKPTAFAPLVETVAGGLGETAASGWANHMVRDLDAALSLRPRLMSFVSALGGQRYVQLKRGTATYAAFLAALTGAAEVARSQGWTPIVPAIDWHQGESDNRADVSVASRIRTMLQLARHLTEDVRAITGQTRDPILFIDQIANVVGTDIWAQPVRQAARDLDGVGNIRCVGPCYQHPTWDGLHMTNRGQNRRGMTLARATVAEVYGIGWRPLIDLGHRWASATQIDIDFWVPGGGLTLDTSGSIISTSGLANHGFEFDDRSGSSPTITGVAVTSTPAAGTPGVGTVRLTLSGAPSGLSCRVGLALRRNSGSSNDGPVTGARSTLRDSAGYVSLYGGETTNNWALAFIREVGRP